MWIVVLICLLGIESSRALEKYTNGDLGLAGYHQCWYNRNCPIFECGKTDDCEITCTPGQCTFLDIRVYDKNIVIIGDDSFVETRITAYNTESITCNLSYSKYSNEQPGPLITYGTGSVSLNLDDKKQYGMDVRLLLNGAHESVNINLKGSGLTRGMISAVNTKNLIIDGPFVAQITLPISTDATTKIFASSTAITKTHKIQKGYLYSLRGTENIQYFCDGKLNKTLCISNADNNPLGLFYGANYNSFCRYGHAECDGIDTSVGNQLDTYTTKYIDGFEDSIDFSAYTTDLLVYWAFCCGKRWDKIPDGALIGPKDADIIVVALFKYRSWGRNFRLDYNFMLSNNAVLIGQLPRVPKDELQTVVGAKQSFSFFGLRRAISRNVIFNLRHTTLIRLENHNVDAAELPFEKGNLNAKVYVGYNANMKIIGGNKSPKLAIYSDSDPECVALKDVWDINAERATITFEQHNISCVVNPGTWPRSPTDLNCSTLLKSTSQIAPSCPAPDTSLTDDIKTYLTDLVMNGDYDVIIKYCADNNITLEAYALKQIKLFVGKKNAAKVIKIITTRKGSVIIEFTVSAPDQAQLDEIIGDKTNAFGLQGTTVKFGDLNLSVASSAVQKAMSSEECKFGNDDCAKEAVCGKNTGGLYKCSCNTGFVGNGQICCKQPSQIFDETSATCVGLCSKTICDGKHKCSNGKYTAYSSQGTKSWREARTYCRSQGVELASFQNNVGWKQAVCACSALNGYSLQHDCWIGLNDIDTEGNYQWTSKYGDANRAPFTYGSELTQYRPWEKDAPNDKSHTQNAISINVHHYGFWQDFNGATNKMYFVCKKKAEGSSAYSPYEYPQSGDEEDVPSDDNYFQINASFVKFVGGVIGIMLVCNLVFMCHINCKYKGNGYSKVKIADSDSEHDVRTINV